MDIRKRIKEGFVFFEGGMGTILQSKGLEPGELPELWNLSRPEVITSIHSDYLKAGANICKTNTFGANSLKFDNCGEIIKAAISNAQKARFSDDQYIALDIGPSGRMLRPLGDFHFEEAVELFGEVVRHGVSGGADLILIETMNDIYEMKAAVVAAKENSDLPVFVTAAFGEDEKMMTGADPAALVAMLEGLGVDALGLNCSFGPLQMEGLVRDIYENASVPVIVNPNAGMPSVDSEGNAIYDVDAPVFAEAMIKIAGAGGRILGGCCGTTPEYIRALTAAVADMTPRPVIERNMTVISSYTHTVKAGEKPLLIGERINPTGKKKFKEALRNHDINYILNEGISQVDCGVHILDVNTGLPEINEVEVLREAVFELQSVTDVPLQIDTSNAEAMEAAMRVYNGKALINSVNGKQESMDEIFPLVKKYGGTVIALTLDESGIPDNADGRVAIAQKILKEAEKYGIKANNIIFDPLAMTISSDGSSAQTVLESIRRIKNNLGCHTSLGVSNISFGLPNRDFVNSSFFVMAMQEGLSMAIMNPYSLDMMKAYHSYLALANLDTACAGYIEFASAITADDKKVVYGGKKSSDVDAPASELQKAIIKGLVDQAFDKAMSLLDTRAPMEVINEEIIPALDIVGKGFENKTVFLPQLLMSADAAGKAFDAVKTKMTSSSPEKGKVILATVKGDIHDIGKNIVRVLLENYGFEVIDLGRDVAPELIVETAASEQVKVVGLSALMTTTVPSMEETIRQLREAGLECTTLVGGAVLTEEYAQMIGADYYCKDAMETVRMAEKLLG